MSAPPFSCAGRARHHPPTSAQRAGTLQEADSQAAGADQARGKDKLAEFLGLGSTGHAQRGSPHSQLATAFAFLFTFDLPELQESVVSYLRDADPEDARWQLRFFYTDGLDGATRTPFDDALESLADEPLGGHVERPAERLSKDVKTLLALMDACKASAHPDIRNAPNAYMARAIAAIVRRALLLAPETGAVVEKQLHSLLKGIEAYHGIDSDEEQMKNALELGTACARRLPTTAWTALHEFAMGIASHIPAPEHKYNLIARCVENVQSFPADQQQDAVERILPMLDKLLSNSKQDGAGSAGVETLSRALCHVPFEQLQPETCRDLFQHAVSLTAQLQEASPTIVDNAVLLAKKAYNLPKESQLEAFKTAAGLIAKSRTKGSASTVTREHALNNCVSYLSTLDDEVVGKAAKDLVIAIDTHLHYVSSSLLDKIYTSCIAPRHFSPNEMRFARLPASDRVDLFRVMLAGCQRGAVPVQWCQTLLPHLPQDVRDTAEEALIGVHKPGASVLSFRPDTTN